MLAVDAGLGREEQLMLALTRSQLAHGSGAVNGIDADDVDWQRFVAIARAHGVLPLVRRALGAGAVLGLASNPRTLVDNAADAAARRSLLMTSKLLQLLAELYATGLTVVPWKGPVLAQMLWSDVALRQYDDLDLLVRRGDLARTHGLLMQRGFRPKVPLPVWQEASYVERTGTLDLQDSDGLAVEVHWTVVPSYYASAMDPAGLWGRLEEETIARRTIFTLSPEDLLVALSIHGFKHRWERLGWIVDVARLLQVRPALDWAGLRERTGHDGSQRIVRIAVGVAGRLFAATETELASHELGADRSAERIVDELVPTALRRIPDGRSVPVSALHARARERWRDRIAYIVTGLTTSNGRDWALMTLPARVSGLYRLIRPFRVVASYVSRATRRE